LKAVKQYLYEPKENFEKIFMLGICLNATGQLVQYSEGQSCLIYAQQQCDGVEMPRSHSFSFSNQKKPEDKKILMLFGCDHRLVMLDLFTG